MIQVPAADFKAHCLQYMDMANSKRETIVITKRGKPVAKLVPYEESPPNIYGWMAGSGIIEGDVIAPIDVEWNIFKE